MGEEIRNMCVVCGSELTQDYETGTKSSALGPGCGPAFKAQSFSIRDGSHCEKCGLKYHFNVEEKPSGS